MTATAPGRVLTCDYAACTRPGIIAVDAWAYCAEHAGRAKDEAAPAPRPAVRAVPAPAAPPVPTSPAQAVAPSPIGQLLEQASGHTIAKVRRLGERIEAQLDDLRTLVREHEAQEAERKAAAEAKEKARAEVERLQRELAEAKAKLQPARKAAEGTVTGPKPCATCGGPVTRPAGTRGSWAKQCVTCKAA